MNAPSLVIEIPLEGAPRVYANTDTWEDEARLLAVLENRAPRLRLVDMVTSWMDLIRKGPPT